MKPTKLDLVTLSLVLLVPAAGYLGCFRGQLARVRRLRQEAADLSERTAHKDATSAELTRTRERLRTLRTRIDRFMADVATEDDAPRAVGAIVRRAREAGVTIDSMSPGSLVDGPTLRYLPITVTGSGEFPRLYDFLVRIERGPTVMTVSRMAVESEPLSEHCTLTVELRVYFAKSDARKEGAA
ncbi:MAG: type 4a pilus biogenesis protein PilO [Planctomycetota bacterium]